MELVAEVEVGVLDGVPETDELIKALLVVPVISLLDMLVVPVGAAVVDADVPVWVASGAGALAGAAAVNKAE
jgi:hypothetical protein